MQDINQLKINHLNYVCFQKQFWKERITIQCDLEKQWLDMRSYLYQKWIVHNGMKW